MLHSLFTIVHYLLSILTWIIIIQFALSWLIVFNVLNTRSPGVNAFVNAIDRITTPLYRPIRRLLPDFGGIDFSPLVVIIIIQILHILLDGVETSLISGTL
jgi:YggT family protein